MSLSVDSFLNTLAKAPIKPVYLIAGAEALLVQEAADALRQRLREQGYSERIVIDTDAGGFDWNDLHQHGASMSLFASLRLLDLRLPTGKPGKEGAQALRRELLRRFGKELAPPHGPRDAAALSVTTSAGRCRGSAVARGGGEDGQVAQGIGARAVGCQSWACGFFILGNMRKL